MSQPIRLQKQDDISYKMRMEAWLERHAPYILFLLIILLIVLIIALVMSIVAHGGANVTVVESGNYYNHFQDVI